MSGLAEATTQLRSLAAALPAVHGGEVRLEVDGEVAWLVLDHAHRRNAVTGGMMVQLAEHVAALPSLDVKAVVLCAAPGPVFCAGGDLRQLGGAPPEAAGRMADAMEAVLQALLELPVISVAAVGGLAVGGGAELVTACDHRVLAPEARVHFVHGRLGIAPGWGGTARLVAHVGRRRALRVLCEAEPLDAEAARAIGLADAVAGAEGLEAAVRSFLAPVLALPRAAVVALKRQVVAGPGGQSAPFAEVWRGPAHQAALERLAAHRR